MTETKEKEEGDKPQSHGAAEIVTVLLGHGEFPGDEKPGPAMGNHPTMLLLQKTFISKRTQMTSTEKGHEIREKGIAGITEIFQKPGEPKKDASPEQEQPPFPPFPAGKRKFSKGQDNDGAGQTEYGHIFRRKRQARENPRRQDPRQPFLRRRGRSVEGV